MKGFLNYLTTPKGKGRFTIVSLLLIFIAVAGYSSFYHNTQSEKENVSPQRTAPTGKALQVPSGAPITPFQGESGSEQHAKEQAAIQESFPWFDKLPLQEENYFVYFDAEKVTFFGLLYPKTSSSRPVEEQVERLKAGIQQRLTDMDIPWKNYPFNWKVTPE